MTAWIPSLAADAAASVAARAVSVVLASGLAFAPAAAGAAPTAEGKADADPESSDGQAGSETSETSETSDADPDAQKDATISAAEDAWGRGEYLEVRSLLEPLADADPLPNRVRREKVLVLLADATLSDSTLPADERQVRARAHLSRVMDTNAQWRLPRKVYSPELYDLALDLREERIGDAGSQCEADKLACEADADAVEAELRQRERELADLQKRYDSQEVAIGEKRTRALAVFPLGISHFLNGDRGIGAAFLAGEAVVGVTGLTLLVIRATVDGCRRTRAFQAGSLKCVPRGGTTQDEVVNRRKAEEAMGWVFLGAVAADIILAQIRFKAFEITDSRPRSELEGGSPRRRRKAPRATVRPKTGASLKGASLGVEVRF